MSSLRSLPPAPSAIDVRVCAGCGVAQPLDADHFHRKRSAASGFHTQCKDCRRCRNRRPTQKPKPAKHLLPVRIHVDATSVSIPLTRGKHAIIDASDFRKVIAHKWQYNKALGKAQCNMTVGGKHTNIYIHRFIMEPIPAGMEVDHIDFDGLNNRRSNLRICTRGENTQHRRKGKRSKVGFKGVQASGSVIRPWKAEITVDGTRLHLGHYASAVEAARAYNAAARELHGGHAMLNDLADGPSARLGEAAYPDVDRETPAGAIIGIEKRGLLIPADDDGCLGALAAIVNLAVEATVLLRRLQGLDERFVPGSGSGKQIAD